MLTALARDGRTGRSGNYNKGRDGLHARRIDSLSCWPGGGNVMVAWSHEDIGLGRSPEP